jgi:hypothetical protein
MDGFKTLPKMKCFKVGGSVQSEAYCGGGKAMKKGGEVDDKKQDKALIKKAFKQHDKAEHDKEPTEIKLKNGGRSKKAVGTVKKFKGGGAIYGAKKDSKDLKSIEAAKEAKPKMIKTGGKVGSDVAKEKFKPAGDAVKMEKVKPTGNKKADAPNAATKRPNFEGSDAAKTNKMKSGDVDKIKKVKPTGNKKADALSAAGKSGKTIKKFAMGGLSSAIPDEPPFQPYPTPPQMDPGYNPYNPNINSNANSNSNMNNNTNTNTNTNTNNNNNVNTGGFDGGFGGGFGGRQTPSQPPVQIDPGYGQGPYPDGPQFMSGSPDLMSNLFGRR